MAANSKVQCRAGCLDVWQLLCFVSIIMQPTCVLQYLVMHCPFAAAAAVAAAAAAAVYV
jgi:hypothetical protein